MTTYNIGDRVVYENTNGLGDSRADGLTGTVTGPGYFDFQTAVKWDPAPDEATPADVPFTANISLLPPTTVDTLRAQADALDAEAREARNESNDLQKRAWKLSDKADNATRLAAQYRNVATDLEARS